MNDKADLFILSLAVVAETACFGIVAWTAVNLSRLNPNWGWLLLVWVLCSPSLNFKIWRQVLREKV